MAEGILIFLVLVDDNSHPAPQQLKSEYKELLISYCLNNK